MCTITLAMNLKKYCKKKRPVDAFLIFRYDLSVLTTLLNNNRIDAIIL